MNSNGNQWNGNKHRWDDNKHRWNHNKNRWDSNENRWLAIEIDAIAANIYEIHIKMQGTPTEIYEKSIDLKIQQWPLGARSARNSKS